MSPVIVLVNKHSVQDSLSKFFQIFKDPLFSVHFPKAPKGTAPKKFLTSETMKLACDENQPVIIVGVDKEDTIEKDIPCKRFQALIRFLPYPVFLPDIIASGNSLKNFKDLVCEENCTVFGFRCTPKNEAGNICAGQIIDKICHSFSHIPEKSQYSEADLKEFLSVIPDATSLKNLFVPNHKGESEIVESFLNSISKIERIARSDNLKEFEKEYDRFYDDEEFADLFPYLGG